MVEAVVRPFVDKLADYTIAATFRQFKYLFCYNRNIRNLRDKVEDLKDKRKGVQGDVDEAKKKVFIIESVVEKWLENVDNLKEEADKVLDRVTNSEMRCLFLKCPNLKTRYLLSRNATKNTAEIVELLQEAGKFNVVGKPAPLNFGLLSYHGSEALKSRISTKKEIIKALDDKDISIVGICGLPGVGKTTMAKEIMTEVKGELFDEVALVVVSEDVNIIRIQEKLAEMLSFPIDEKTNEIARALRLADRLTQDNNRRILVILDDLWKEFDLETLGIRHHGGLKILLTSRSKHVCERTGAEGFTFEVGVLPREEAFVLFQDVAKISNDATELKAIAEQVAEECKGLPLALEVVGRTLRNEQQHAWKDALNQLQNFQHDDEVFSSIQFSYDYLKSDEHRFLLLLCSLFPEDESIPIEILVRYARGLEMFKNTETLSDTRNRAKTVFDNLKSCHFLLSGDKKEEEVKLHDVIRDFCLWIVSKGEHRYMVKHNLATEWPEHDNHESYSAVSLTFKHFHEEILLPSGLRYGNLKFLRLLKKGNSKVDIPVEFLDDLQELRVLDFSRVNIRSPIQLSAGLRTLCLNDCDLEFGISFFGSLKKLEILTFHESVLSVDFPHDEMVELSNLRLLDLRFWVGPRPVPPGFLSGMKKLEELCLGDYSNISYEEKRHIIEEVSSLKALNALQIRTDDIQFLMQLSQACSAKLERFTITTGYIGTASSVHFRRYLYLSRIDPNMLTEPGIKSLMGRSDELQLHVEGWKSPVIELDEDGFTNLKSLDLHSLDSEYLIDAAGSIPSRTFRNLENLKLLSMGNLKEICNVNLSRMEHLTSDGVSKPAMFCNLKSISVHSCNEIKRLFTESVAKCMVNLQKLRIGHCSSLKEVVSMNTRGNESTEPLVFPKLKKVYLHELRSFVSFSSQSNAVGLRQTLLNNQVELPHMEKLEIRDLNSIRGLLSVEMPFGSLNGLRKMEVNSCDNLVNIAQSNSIKLLQNLEILLVHECGGLNVIFDFEGLNVNDADVEIGMLGQLKSLRLEFLGILHITMMVPEGIHVFQNLNSIAIWGCSRLRYLFPTSMINSLVGLETLRVDCCDEMEEIFGREGGGTGTASKIEFRQLRSITLDRLPRFKMFCSHNYELVFPSLDHLRIQYCPAMTKFCSGQLNAPKLEKVHIGFNEFVDVSNFPNL